MRGYSTAWLVYGNKLATTVYYTGYIADNIVTRPKTALSTLPIIFYDQFGVSSDVAMTSQYIRSRIRLAMENEGSHLHYDYQF